MAVDSSDSTKKKPTDASPAPENKSNGESKLDGKDKTKGTDASHARTGLSAEATTPGDLAALDAMGHPRTYTVQIKPDDAPTLGQRIKLGPAQGRIKVEGLPETKQQPGRPETKPSAEKPQIKDSPPTSGQQAAQGERTEGKPAPELAPEAKTAPGLNGRLSSPDGKDWMEVKGGQIADKSGKIIGSIDQNGKVQTSQDVDRTDVNSLRKGWKFQGYENGKSRNFDCGNDMSSGRAFIPDNSGKTVAYDVRMGMLINHETREQYGRPDSTEGPDGKLTGGYVETGDPPKRRVLSSIVNAVVDVQRMGEGGEKSRRIQSISSGDETGADGKVRPGHYLNVNQEVQGLEQHRKGVEATERNDINAWHPIDRLTGARDARVYQNKQEIATDNALIEQLHSAVATGQINHDTFNVLERQSHAAKAGGEAKPGAPESAAEPSKPKEGDKPAEASKEGAEAPKPPSVEPPAISGKPGDPNDVHTVAGSLRIGSDVYDIKQGKLYHQGETKPCGDLLPGYQIKLASQKEPIQLANEQRVLMQFKFIGDSTGEWHRIMGMGRPRIGEDGHPIAGGLIDADKFVQRAEYTKNEVAKANTDVDASRGIAAKAVYALLGAHGTEHPLDYTVKSLEVQNGILKGHLDDTFQDGFKPDFSNNHLDRCVRATQRIADTIGANGASAEELAKQLKEVDKSTGESGIQAVIAVGTAGVGSAISASMEAGELTEAALAAARLKAAGQTLKAGAVIGGVARGIGEISDNSTLASVVRSTATGTVDGVVQAGAGVARGYLDAAKAGKIANMAYLTGTKAGRIATAAYMTGEAFVQHTAMATDAAVREGKSVEAALREALQPQNIAIGMGAQLVGEALGSLGGAAAKQAGAAEHGLAQTLLKDTTNAYSNAATAAIPEAANAERQRIATEHGIRPEQVSDEMYQLEASTKNMIAFCNQRGLESARMAVPLAIGSHGVQAAHAAITGQHDSPVAEPKPSADKPPALTPSHEAPKSEPAKSGLPVATSGASAPSPGHAEITAPTPATSAHGDARATAPAGGAYPETSAGPGHEAPATAGTGVSQVSAGPAHPSETTPPAAASDATRQKGQNQPSQNPSTSHGSGLLSSGQGRKPGSGDVPYERYRPIREQGLQQQQQKSEVGSTQQERQQVPNKLQGQPFEQSNAVREVQELSLISLEDEKLAAWFARRDKGKLPNESGSQQYDRLHSDLKSGDPKKIEGAVKELAEVTIPRPSDNLEFRTRLAELLLPAREQENPLVGKALRAVVTHSLDPDAAGAVVKLLGQQVAKGKSYRAALAELESIVDKASGNANDHKLSELNSIREELSREVQLKDGRKIDSGVQEQVRAFEALVKNAEKYDTRGIAGLLERYSDLTKASEHMPRFIADALLNEFVSGPNAPIEMADADLRHDRRLAFAWAFDRQQFMGDLIGSTGERANAAAGDILFNSVMSGVFVDRLRAGGDLKATIKHNLEASQSNLEAIESRTRAARADAMRAAFTSLQRDLESGKDLASPHALSEHFKRVNDAAAASAETAKATLSVPSIHDADSDTRIAMEWYLTPNDKQKETSLIQLIRNRSGASKEEALAAMESMKALLNSRPLARMRILDFTGWRILGTFMRSQSGIALTDRTWSGNWPNGARDYRDIHITEVETPITPQSLRHHFRTGTNKEIVDNDHIAILHLIRPLLQDHLPGAAFAPSRHREHPDAFELHHRLLDENGMYTGKIMRLVIDQVAPGVGPWNYVTSYITD